MSVLFRISPRSRPGLLGLWAKRRPENVAADVFYDAYFGMVGQVESGQAQQTTDYSGDILAASFFVQTGQAAQSSAATGNVLSNAVVDTTQVQYSDVVVQVPINAQVESGQSDQSTVVVATPQPYRVLEQKGWLDGAIDTPHTIRGAWRLSPRSASGSLAGQLIKLEASRVGDDVVADAFFEYNYSTYTDGIGTAAVAWSVRYISAAGGDDQLAFGNATVFNLAQYAYPAGIGSEEAFGSPGVFTLSQYVSVDGMQNDAFGAPSLENLNRTIFPQRIDPTLAFGVTEVIGPRYISGATVGNGSAIGDHAAAGSRTVYPSGVASTSAFGTDYIAFSTRDVRPSSIQKPSNQVPAVLIGNAARDMDIYGIGNEDVGMGDPIIGEPPFDVIWSAGVGDASEFGEADFDMTGPTRRIQPGWPINNPSIRTEFGTARIIPHTIHPANVNTPAYGRAWVSNKIRYIDLSIGERGIAGSRYGTQWVSNWIRYLDPAGFDHSEVWWPFGPLPTGELAAVRHVSDGKLYPSGIAGGAIGDASVRINLC